MTTATLVVFFALCFTRVSHVAAATGNQLTCKPGETTTNKIENVGTFLIECPAQTSPPLAPAEPSGEAGVFRTPEPKDDASDSVQIKDVVPGARLGQKGGKGAVDILQLPNEPKKFYLRCTKATGSSVNGCVIAVEVAASTRLGPNTCSVEGSRIALAIEKGNETANFSCGEGRQLRPTDFAKKAFNESCDSEVPLPDKVQVAQTGQEQYKVTVPELPKQKTTICYVCVKSGTEASKCQVAISIAASNASGALAVGFAARAAAAVGLVGLTVAVLQAW